MSNKEAGFLSCDLWQQHEQRVHQALSLALQKLADRAVLPAGEPQITRELWFLLQESVQELDPDGVLMPTPPYLEACNQPDPEDRAGTPRESKRPDIQWGFRDIHSDPRKSARNLAIECKRLGSPTSPNWNLNENYVVRGISRFVEVEWAYGQSCPSGTMVGYVQNMNLDSILLEVNETARRSKIPEVVRSGDAWQQGGVSRLHHQFERPTRPSPFELAHLWVDVRGCYPQTPVT